MWIKLPSKIVGVKDKWINTDQVSFIEWGKHPECFEVSFYVNGFVIREQFCSEKECVQLIKVVLRGNRKKVKKQ